jgi:hypothetical protein
MIRTIRLFGFRSLSLAISSQNFFQSSFGMEAPPFYSSVAISVRIWGTNTTSGVTDSLDETQSITFTRIPWQWVGGSSQSGINNLLPDFNGGVLESGPGILQKYGEAWCIMNSGGVATLAEDECFIRVLGGDVARNGSGIAIAGGNPYLPNAKEQRLKIDIPPSTNRIYTVNRTGGPPSTYDITVGFLAPEFIADPSVLIPAGGRGALTLWGLSGTIDATAWTAARWRDYRGAHAFPSVAFEIIGKTGFFYQATVTIS